MTQQWHAYTCEKGCGHTTIIDKFYKGKRVFCGVCGTKSTMVYKGEQEMTFAPKTENPFIQKVKEAKKKSKPATNDPFFNSNPNGNTFF